MIGAYFIGNLTRDGELKHTSGGLAVLEFSLAVNERVKHGDTWEDYANFFDCVMFGKRAEAVAKYLTKGARVGVTSRPRQERWEKDGEKRSKVKFYVDDLDLLGDRRKSDDAPASEGFEDDAPPF